MYRLTPKGSPDARYSTESIAYGSRRHRRSTIASATPAAEQITRDGVAIDQPKTSPKVAATIPVTPAPDQERALPATGN